MPRIRIADTRDARNRTLAEMQKLRKDRKTARFLFYVTCAMLAFQVITSLADLWFHKWQAVASPVAGCFILSVALFSLKTQRRTILLRARVLRTQLAVLKEMEYIDLSVLVEHVRRVTEEDFDAHEKPKIH